MPHPLVQQLRFARSEFQRALAGVGDEDARRRLLPMNCLSWSVGHLAWQEQRYWLQSAQGLVLRPALNSAFAYGAPASTPALAEVWDDWRAVTAAADPWLDALTTARLADQVELPGIGVRRDLGSLLLRTIYHYWYHTGENMAVRQQLGHADLPDFVGDIDAEAPYRPE